MRKQQAPKRPVVKDPVYNSELVTMLVNKILQDGKKSTAERIVYGALEQCREKTGTDPVGTLEKGDRQHPPGPRGSFPPRWWRDLPGPGRREAGSLHHPRAALDGHVHPSAS